MTEADLHNPSGTPWDLFTFALKSFQPISNECEALPCVTTIDSVEPYSKDYDGGYCTRYFYVSTSLASAASGGL